MRGRESWATANDLADYRDVRSVRRFYWVYILFVQPATALKRSASKATGLKERRLQFLNHDTPSSNCGGAGPCDSSHLAADLILQNSFLYGRVA